MDIFGPDTVAIAWYGAQRSLGKERRCLSARANVHVKPATPLLLAKVLAHPIDTNDTCDPLRGGAIPWGGTGQYLPTKMDSVSQDPYS